MFALGRTVEQLPLEERVVADIPRDHHVAIPCAIRSASSDGKSDAATRIRLRGELEPWNHSIATKSNPKEPACRTGRPFRSSSPDSAPAKLLASSMSGFPRGESVI